MIRKRRSPSTSPLSFKYQAPSPTAPALRPICGAKAHLQPVCQNSSNVRCPNSRRIEDFFAARTRIARTIHSLGAVAPHSRRFERRLSAEETRFFETINEPLPGGQELVLLRSKREAYSLTEEEQRRLVDLEHQREVTWARKLKAVSQLADLRGQDFESLYQQLGLTLRSEK